MSLKIDPIVTGIVEACSAWLDYRKIIGHDIRTPESFISIPISDYLTSLRGENEVFFEFEHSYRFSEDQGGLVDLKIERLNSEKVSYIEFKKLREDHSYRYAKEKNRIINDLERLAQVHKSLSNKSTSCYFLLFGAPDEFVDFAFYNTELSHITLYRDRPRYSGQYDSILSLNFHDPVRELKQNDMAFTTKLLLVKNIEHTIISEEPKRLSNPPYLVAVWQVSAAN